MKNIEVTEDMITAARDVLEGYAISADGDGPTTIRLALGAALAAAPEPERATAGRMAAVVSDYARAPWLLIVMNDMDEDGFGIRVHASGLPDEEAIRALLMRIVGEMSP